MSQYSMSMYANSTLERMFSAMTSSPSFTHIASSQTPVVLTATSSTFLKCFADSMSLNTIGLFRGHGGFTNPWPNTFRTSSLRKIT
ncbi:hypothetical protein ATCV1_z021L [Acanthocystis turfacea chlorella virus 1]|uniref:Uncharacterized protein z021L n=1 Tax=Chlorovirus heliozoae TaxID=322019 RepID=A7K7Y1_9PHYC|nr:hypothetical protein ATCV1_z021L [Acanthocystis turfacea chlorella virus 1]ABT16155.1 hypothetical protein ATCV1_z021L [Acanthocystis turfacea chlorella virus 1]